MSESIDAIFDHGVLRPLVPLALPDQARVRVIVETLSDSASIDEIEGQKAAAEDGGAGADFDKELDTLLFDGPILSPDFTRADIYLDRE